MNNSSSRLPSTNDAFKALLQERPNSCQTYYASDIRPPTQSMNPKNLEKGASILKNYIMRDTLTQIILYAFSPSGQLQYEKNLAVKRLEKLAQAVEIRQRAVSRE